MSDVATAPDRASGDSAAIRPFRVEVAQADIDDLRQRLRATRWPEKETVSDLTQGVPLATARELARYWAEDYDFGRLATRLNAFPQFLTEIDGLDIHFIHARSPHPRRAAADHHARLARLDHRDAQRHRPADRPDGLRRRRGGRLRRGGPIDARLRVLRQADDHRLGPGPYRRRLDRPDAAPRLHALRRPGRRLGRPDHRCDRGDGAARAARDPLQHARHRRARRLPGPHVQRLRDRAPGADRSVCGRAARLRPAELPLHEGRRVRARDGEPPADAVRPRRFAGRARGLDARPRRLQPRGHREGLRREAGRQPHPRRGPRQHHDDLGDEHRHLVGSPVLGEHAGLLRRQGRQGPGGGQRLPARALPGAAELDRAAYPKLVYFNELDRGNHFAAWQEPELFTQELRAAFRSLRTGTGS